jgi:hypothetical protein
MNVGKYNTNTKLEESIMTDKESINTVETASMRLVDTLYEEIWSMEDEPSQTLRNHMMAFHAGARLMLFEIRILKNAINQVDDTIEY